MASNGTTDMESIAIEENSPLIKNNNNTPTNNNNNNGNIGNNILEKNKVSFHGTFLNLLKSSLGAGLLGFPFGFRKAGWLGGIISCLILQTRSIIFELSFTFIYKSFWMIHQITSLNNSITSVHLPINSVEGLSICSNSLPRNSKALPGP